MNTIEDHIINFLARKESPEDVQQLKAWLAADPSHRDELRQMLAAWDVAGAVEIADKVSPDEAYRRFMFRLSREIPAKTTKEISRMDTVIRTIRRIAAVFVVGFVGGALCQYFWVANHPEPVAFVESAVPLGSKSEIKLPDGSVVWLNAGSTLRYPTDYGRETRDIYLSGEGYFKVARQTEKPFTVHTALMKIKALGTEFNVKAYPEENRVETTLIKGEVAINQVSEGLAIDKPVILKPGQKFSAGTTPATQSDEATQPQAATTDEPLPQPVTSQLSPDVADAEVSWKERNWRIEKEELQTLAVKIERRYDVQIEVDERLKSYRFTGTIKDESLEQVLYAMQLTAPILFKINGKMVSIHVDPKKMK